MRKIFFRYLAIAVLSAGFFAGCPWSSSPNGFKGAKGISLPHFGGPPPQTEPPVAESASQPTARATDAELD